MSKHLEFIRAEQAKKYKTFEQLFVRTVRPTHRHVYTWLQYDGKKGYNLRCCKCGLLKKRYGETNIYDLLDKLNLWSNIRTGIVFIGITFLTLYLLGILQ